MWGPNATLRLALHWQGEPEYGRLLGLAKGIRDGLAERTARGLALYLMLDADVARTLGLILKEELGVPVEILAVDGVELRDFDYIDLGRVRLPSGTVPVTIKSLLFRDSADERVHHHKSDHDHEHHDHDDHHHHDHHHHHPGHSHTHP